jgi:hypothetical protein
MSSASKLVPAPHRVPCASEAFTPDSLGGWIPLQIKLSLDTWSDLLPVVWEMHPGDKGGDKSPCLQSWQRAPRNVAGISSWDTGHWGSLGGSNVLLCWHRPSRLVSKGRAPRTKRSTLIYPCKQVTEAKSKSQPTYGCMWLHWLFYFPSDIWPSSCFNFLSFVSLLCHPFPPPHY